MEKGRYMDKNREGGSKKKRKKDGLLSTVSGKETMRLTSREIAREGLCPVVRTLQQAERSRGINTQYKHTHTTFPISAGCGRSCLEPAVSAW